MTDAIADRAPRWAPLRSRLRFRPPARLDSNDATLLAAAVVVGLSGYFLLFPGVDLAVSRLFYRPEAGFFLSGEPVLRMLRKSSSLVMALMLLAPITRWLWRVARRRAAARAARQAAFVTASLAAGPGLVVNSLLKEFWGRARPVQVDLFGGEADFTAAWIPSQACASNCSFVSGEGAGAAWMVGAALALSPRAWRPFVGTLAGAYAVALSMNRIAFGGHFLSDVALSWALTALVLVLVHRAVSASPAAIRRFRPRALAVGVA